MIKIQTVSILGCGWLGTALALALLDDGYIVKGSVSSHKSSLNDPRIILYDIHVGSKLSGGSNMHDFFKTDYLIWMIPFKRSLDPPEIYADQAHAVLRQLRKMPVPYVMVVGSTSIYPMTQRIASEEQPIVPDTRRAQVLLDVEQLFLAQSQTVTALLRVGGLHGYDRNSSRMLDGKQKIKTPEAPVNLIHRDDCVGIIKALLGQKKGGVYNVVATQHPSRREFYTHRAKVLGLPNPKFETTSRTHYKRVQNDKIKATLSYNFSFPDPMKWA